MHKAKKYLLITALATLATGLSTAGIGQAMGGLERTQDYFQEISNSYPRQSKTFKNIKDVYISSDSQFVQMVENTDATNKDFILSYQDTPHTKVTVSEQAGKLKVTNAIKSGYYGASSLFDRSLVGKPIDSQKILLTVPQGTNLENLSIHADKGDITLEKIQAKKSEIIINHSDNFDSTNFIDISQSKLKKGNIASIGTLSMRVTDSQLQNIRLFCENGRIDLDKVGLENTNIETNTASIAGNINHLKGNIYVENGFGSTSLSFPTSLQKTTVLQLSSEEGQIYLNGETNSKNYTSAPDNPTEQLQIHSYAGDIRLSFRE